MLNDRHFCHRCGKRISDRAGDLTGGSFTHACTPPAVDMEVKLRNVIPTWSGVAVFNGLTRAGWNPVHAFLEAERRTRGSALITNIINIGAGDMSVEAPGKSWDLSPFLKAGRIRLSDIPEGEARDLYSALGFSDDIPPEPPVNGWRLFTRRRPA